MRFTIEEMMFLHSITPGRNMFGMKLYCAEDAEKDTLDRLLKKGILKDDYKLSVNGLITAKTVEDYKACEKYIIINSVLVGVLRENELIVIVPDSKECDIFRFRGEVFLLYLVQQFDFLRMDSTEREVVPEKFQELDSLLTILYKNNDSLLIGYFLNSSLIEEIVLYESNGKTYLHNLKTGNVREMSPKSMRIKIASLFRR